MSFFRFLLLFTLLLLASCASLRGGEQRVKVATVPPGADVIVDFDVAGKTPGFFSIRRQRKQSLLLTKPGFQAIRLPLKSTYRWRDSFFANMVFLPYAPIGWAVDLLTGRAWEYEPVPVLEMQGHELKKTSDVTPQVIAIAPPQSDQEILSDELAELIEKSAQARFPHARILHYKETVDRFFEYDYSNDHKARPELRDDLYDALKATHILESQVQNISSERVQMSAELRDIYSDKVSEKFALDIDSEGVDFQKRNIWSKRILSLVSFLPNTVTFDTASARASIYADGTGASQDEARYYAVSNKPTTLWSYLSGIGLRNTKSPKLIKTVAFTFRFVPSLSLYYDRFRFESKSTPNELQGADYSWYNLQGGVGPEIGIESTIGHQYFQVIPGLSYNWIYWNQNGIDQSTTGLGYNVEVEAGWSVTILSHINLRLFARTSNPVASLWQETLDRSTGRHVNLFTSQQTVAGIAVGYYFPEARSYVKEWLR